MKKKWIIGFVAVILLISLLPVPKKVERTYYGVNVGNKDTVDIVIKLKYLRFLFLEDKLNGTITVKTETETFTYGEHLFYIGEFATNHGKNVDHYLSGWYYNDGLENVSVWISSDFNKILIRHETDRKEDIRYIGSVEHNELEDAKEYFSGYYYDS